MTKKSLPPVLRRWRLLAAVTGVTALTGGGVLLAASSDPGTALAFHSVAATRLLDTRPTTQVGDRGTPLGAQETMSLSVNGLPDDATAVSINVTVVDGTSSSFLTIYPNGDAQPATSTINWSSTDAVANSATVNVKADRTLRIFNLKGSVNVVIDLMGYYAPTPAGGGTGPKGDKGDPGTPGAKGDKGDPGTPGAGAGVYLYAANAADELVLLGAPVAFRDPGAAQGGITPVLDLDENAVGFIVPTDGIYKVSFAVVADVPHQLMVQVNGLNPAGPATLFGADQATSGSPSIPNSGTAVFPALNGDQISIVNFASTGTDGDLNFVSPTGTIANSTVSAWILIERLGDIVV